MDVRNIGICDPPVNRQLSIQLERDFQKNKNQFRINEFFFSFLFFLPPFLLFIFQKLPLHKRISIHSIILQYSQKRRGFFTLIKVFASFFFFFFSFSISYKFLVCKEVENIVCYQNRI